MQSLSSEVRGLPFGKLRKLTMRRKPLLVILGLDPRMTGRYVHMVSFLSLSNHEPLTMTTNNQRTTEPCSPLSGSCWRL